MSAPRLILASGSPRRQQLLREAGYEFVIDPADVDEDDYPQGTRPGDLAESLALRKAQAVAERHPADVVVIGADTVVAFGDTILGKPDDADDALVRAVLRHIDHDHHSRGVRPDGRRRKT